MGECLSSLPDVRGLLLAPYAISCFLYSKDGFHRTPPLSMRTSVPHSALDVIMTCHAAVLCMIRPNRSSACRSCGPLKWQNPPRPALLLFAMILG